MKIKHKQKFSTIVTILFVISFSFFVYAEQPFDKAVFNDSDQDGLSDEEEKIYGTNPFNRDTDGDGYSDGAEVKSGYDPLKPAPGDKIINTSDNTNTFSNSNKILDDFDSKLVAFIENKNGGDISLDELGGFVTENIGDEIALIEKNSTLTEDEIKNIKIKKQNYGDFSEEKRKSAEKEDAIVYLSQVLEILVANYPSAVEDSDDLVLIYQAIIANVEKLNSANPDYEYFRDLGRRLALAQEQIKLVEVPEKFYEEHIRLLTVIKGFVGLKEAPFSMEDEIGKIVIVSRSMALGEEFADILANVSRKMSESY